MEKVKKQKREVEINLTPIKTLKENLEKRGYSVNNTSKAGEVFKKGKIELKGVSRGALQMKTNIVSLISYFD